jgi:hypothetical protein
MSCRGFADTDEDFLLFTVDHLLQSSGYLRWPQRCEPKSYGRANNKRCQRVNESLK